MPSIFVPSILTVLSNRVYLSYWLGTLILQSVFQSQTLLFAWSWSGGEFDQAFWVYVATNSPFVLLTLVSGYLADRFSRKILHGVGQIFIFSGCVSGIIYFVWDPRFIIGLITLLVINAGIAIRGPSYQATMTTLFDKTFTEAVLSAHGLTVSIARIVAPFLVGSVIAGNCTALPSIAGVAASLWTLFVITMLDKGPKHSVLRPSDSGIGSGIWSPSLIVLPMSLAFCCSGLTVLLPSWVRANFGDNANAYTLVMLCFGLGAIVAAFIGPISKRLFFGYELGILTVTLGIGISAVASLTQPVVISAILFVSGAAQFLMFIRVTAYVVRSAPAHQKALRLSVNFFGTYLGWAIGAVAWGLMANTVGNEWTLGASGVLLILLGIYLVTYASNITLEGRIAPSNLSQKR